MQDASEQIENRPYFAVPNGGETADQLHSLLSTSLPSLYRSANRILRNPADAEDAVQDALLAAFRHLDQFEGRSQMSTWLTAIVNNSARMQLRSRLRHTHVSLDEPMGEDPASCLSNRLADGAPSPEEECRDSELNGSLRCLTTQLPAILLRTFQLRDIEGLSIRETATLLGVPIGTVKARLARARKKLKYHMRRAIKPRPGILTNAERTGAKAKASLNRFVQ
jgi:RNA polymerase sigma-70 factor (ECF subfamily)